jgi:hypothetical protein
MRPEDKPSILNAFSIVLCICGQSTMHAHTVHMFTMFTLHVHRGHQGSWGPPKQCRFRGIPAPTHIFGAIRVPRSKGPAAFGRCFCTKPKIEYWEQFTNCSVRKHSHPEHIAWTSHILIDAVIHSALFVVLTFCWLQTCFPNITNSCCSALAEQVPAKRSLSDFFGFLK